MNSQNGCLQLVTFSILYGVFAHFTPCSAYVVITDNTSDVNIILVLDVRCLNLDLSYYWIKLTPLVMGRQHLNLWLRTYATFLS